MSKIIGIDKLNINKTDGRSLYLHNVTVKVKRSK